MRRPFTALIVIGATLGVGATALAQSGGSELSIDFQDGCLDHSRVVVKVAAPSDRAIEALSVSAHGREVLRLNGLSGEARMRVRLASPRGQVTVSGELAGGETFTRSRDYRGCAPEPTPEPAPQRNTRPEPTLTGGGEG
ncbi:hypothetical protein OJ997_27800 [Solirubrobacter phytolaccae]|uniref:Uncharacterized protein n=1 Tax=Solirubrobacter phytolaccae TaxID=1404360 RepID=A0A9X3SDW6_9ACTN|nr:hypothetical protein [Solirubrobacter phytolaccae]MDA0184145.1 hypothetical protein [Solirubrobacter phytolaccae]